MKDAVDKGLIKGCSLRFANVYSNHERFAEHIIPHIFNNLLKDGKVVLLENSKKIVVHFCITLTVAKPY